MEPARSYRELMAELATLPSALAAEQARINLWYDQQVASAKAALERAERAERAASDAILAARSTMDWTRSESHRLWRELERRVGSVGPEPAPALYVDPEDDPIQLLRDVSDRVGRRPAPKRERPHWLIPLLVVIAVIAAAGLLALASLSMLPGN